jgi:hypothetical protein
VEIRKDILSTDKQGFSQIIEKEELLNSSSLSHPFSSVDEIIVLGCFESCSFSEKIVFSSR